MLTRLVVRGFKNLDIDVQLGPFTCIAGPNGVGKSNVFDAITFLSALAEKPLLQAILAVRGGAARSGDVRGIFRRVGDSYVDVMSLTAEMIIPPVGEDALGQKAKASVTYLRYDLTLANSQQAPGAPNGGIEIVHESLTQLSPARAASTLGFPHSVEFRKSAILGRRTSPYISTEGGFVLLHADSEGGKGGGRPRKARARDLPRTMLSSAEHDAAEHRTATLARQEMVSWTQLQLEPSALRASDDFSAPTSIGHNGAHLPATLRRIAREASVVPGAEANVYARVANRLSQLVEEVRSVSVDVDEKRQLVGVVMTDRTGSPHPAAALSDGTLRFLALVVMSEERHPRPLLCLEEPENGMHPRRIPAMLELLRDLAVDPFEPVGPDNPLRQVIVNTHSPKVVAEVEHDSLLVVALVPDSGDSEVAHLRPLPNTWRSPNEQSEVIARGDLLAYLDPLSAGEPSHDAPRSARPLGASPPRPLVKDRPDLQMLLPFDARAAE